ncbi:VanZ family protein [Paenibacillus sp. YYML68]|uniref:VanZ family protein n=1 Tax=Paenibacillus sp. YYML68 TaxID=2909250 RepID=UPI0037CB9527
MNRKYVSVIVVFILYVMTLIYLTVLSNHVLSNYRGEPIFKLTVSIIGIMQTQSVEYVIKNVFGNVLLFIPYGFLLPILLIPYIKKTLMNIGTTALLALITTITIEFIQVYYAHRVFDIDDMILNEIGFLIGAFFFWLLEPSIRKSILDSSK